MIGRDYPIHTLAHARESLLLLEHRYRLGRVPALGYVLLRQRITERMVRLEPGDLFEDRFDRIEAMLMTVQTVVNDMITKQDQSRP